MKKLATLAALVLFAASISSCTKCINCSYTDKSGTTVSRKICGKKDYRATEQASIEADAAAAGVTATCD